jgi:hypothetical protein
MCNYKIKRSNISFNSDNKSMICTFTITHTKTKETHIFKNIYLAKDYTDAFLVFPSTNEEVYINKNND